MTESFETAWRRWVNATCRDTHEMRQLLERCITAATTIDELILVFRNATENGGIEGVRPEAVRKMLPLVSTREEAERVCKLVSKNTPCGHFTILREEAAAKLASFATA